MILFWMQDFYLRSFYVFMFYVVCTSGPISWGRISPGYWNLFESGIKIRVWTADSVMSCRSLCQSDSVHLTQQAVILWGFLIRKLILKEIYDLKVTGFFGGLCFWINMLDQNVQFSGTISWHHLQRLKSLKGDFPPADRWGHTVTGVPFTHRFNS